jgi:hypothetical protein
VGIFAYNIAANVLKYNEDLEPISDEECRYRGDWLKWKDVIKSELNSLTIREVFLPVVQMPECMKPINYK